MSYDFSNRHPEIHENTFIADGAQLIGKVTLKEGVSVWHNTVIRADINDIIIGKNSNIQDNSVIHVADAYKAIIGADVTVGHNVIIHACTIGNNCLIGMGSIIMDGAEIGNDSIVAAGALVSPGKKFPDRSLIIGSPAILKRQLSDDEVLRNQKSAEKYLRVWKAYKEKGIPCYKGPREIRL